MKRLVFKILKLPIKTKISGVVSNLLTTSFYLEIFWEAQI